MVQFYGDFSEMAILTETGLSFGLFCGTLRDPNSRLSETRLSASLFCRTAFMPEHTFKKHSF